MDYSGGRTTDTIVDWLNKKTGPASTEVDCEGMKTKTADSKMALSYFGALEGDLFDTFMKTAKSPEIGEKFSFFHTNDSGCAKDYNIEKAPGISLTRTFDESPLAFNGTTEADLLDFGKKSSVPRLITFSEDYIEPIFGDKNPAIILFTEETDTDYQKVFE